MHEHWSHWSCYWRLKAKNSDEGCYFLPFTKNLLGLELSWCWLQCLGPQKEVSSNPSASSSNPPTGGVPELWSHQCHRKRGLKVQTLIWAVSLTLGTISSISGWWAERLLLCVKWHVCSNMLLGKYPVQPLPQQRSRCSYLVLTWRHVQRDNYGCTFFMIPVL